MLVVAVVGLVTVGLILVREALAVLAAVALGEILPAAVAQVVLVLRVLQTQVAVAAGLLTTLLVAQAARASSSSATQFKEFM